MIIVEENEAFCADLIVIGSAIDSGACYIETSSLDGEKNLKPRSSIKETQAIFNNRDKLPGEFPISFQGDVPNPKLEEFDGAIEINNKKIAINYKQMLLRGAVLRNTKWILGVVIYTG